MRPGDRVGVAALSAPVDGERLERGIEELRRLGFEPRLADNLRARRGLFAGGDAERLAAFHDLAADPSVAAIIFARGGHGVLRLLPRLDWSLLAKRPRSYVGYSDLTPFLLEVVRRLGLVAFHGPMAAVELDRGLTDAEANQLLSCLAGEVPPPIEVRPLAGTGRIAGVLAGGCLSLLAATAGTPFAAVLAGGLFFWEDVEEPPYRVDRMLTQLRLAGALQGVRAMIVGETVAPRRGAGRCEELLQEWSREEGWPSAVGCASGHCTPNLTLPLGAAATLDLERGLLLLG